MNRFKTLFLSGCLVFLFAPIARPAVLTPASLSDIDVQVQVNLAADGDTIQLPVGVSTWVHTVNIVNKAITIRGMGMDPVTGTVIYDGTPSTAPWNYPNNPFVITGQAGKPWRISNLTMSGVGLNGGEGITIKGTCKNWRIDHIKFYDLGTPISSFYSDYTYGLIDHCSFYVTQRVDTTGGIPAIMAGGNGDQSWAQPLMQGTSNALFVEDCLFQFNDFGFSNIVSIHGGQGARIVFRYNKTNLVLEAWGSYNATGRGVLSYEIYNNNFGGIYGHAPYAMVVKGGVGVFFNNTMESTAFPYSTCYLGDYRTEAHQTLYIAANNSTFYQGRCNGLCPIDGNLPVDASASGIHTGANDSNTLVCAGKNWAANQWVGFAVRNSSDSESAGYIVSNTADTLVTCPVIIFSTTGYSVCSNSDEDKQVTIPGIGLVGPLKSFVSVRQGMSSYKKAAWFVQTSTDISAAATASVSGGSGAGTVAAVKYMGLGNRNHWDTGDRFVITNGYPGIDQIGRAPGIDTLADGTTVQKSEPWYEWNNTYNSAPLHFTVPGSFPAGHIVQNRDYYNIDKTSLGYVPYTYPHPMTLADVVDTSSPMAPSAVRDGSGSSDIDFTYSTTTLSAKWEAGSDLESGISGYRYAIGTTPGGTEVLAYQAVSSAYVNRAGLSLNMGATYYFSVKSVNGLGLVSTGTAVSNGQYIAPDGTQPGAPGAVYDGTGADISTTSLTTQLSANWTAGADSESGISGYKYAIGTSPSAQDAVGWTANAGLSVIKTGLSLSAGTTYYFSVKAINGAGLESVAANSNGVVVISTAVVDTSSPTAPGTVRDGTGTDITSTQSNNTLSANWTAGADAESGLSGYKYAIGTTAGGVNTAGWTTIGNVLTVTRSSLVLSAGTTYYFSVKAVNTFGLTGPATNSNGQYVVAIDTGDTTPPSDVAQVRDGTGADISNIAISTQLKANWDSSVDAESGIAKYWYAIGTSAGASDTVGWTDNGQSTSLTAGGLALSVGVTYYISVIAENGVGLQSVSAASSNGQVVGWPPPTDTTDPVVSGVAAQGITMSGAVIIWTTDEASTSQVEYGKTTGYGKVTIEDSSLNTAHSAVLADLTAGTLYHYRVISRDALNNETVSADYTFTTSAPVYHIAETVHAYPNPYNLSSPNPVKFRAAGAASSEVSIYTISGRLIKTIPGAEEISWDGTNTDGQKVGRGIYIYKITTSSGGSATGKIALTK
ncbi:MAG: hypothetical protein A2297_09315 [Elusimicrobia bacterium RIFOXYB2_FULL_48_7]|nr:MAG: hypothetical protein A2297_09315 [Elusimicrobia bacterium RIFOXYB2_FULL_48_7]